MLHNALREWGNMGALKSVCVCSLCGAASQLHNGFCLPDPAAKEMRCVPCLILWALALNLQPLPLWNSHQANAMRTLEQLGRPVEC